MFKNKNLKIGTKIIMQVLLVLMAVLISVFMYIIITTRDTDIENANKQLTEITEKNATIISGELESPLDVAETLSSAMQGFENIKADQRRDYYNNIMENILKENNGVLGVWTIWEPNALDGMDSTFVGKEGSDQSGRFVPYWVWNNDKVELTSCADYETEGAGDYYLLAKNSGTETILEPFEYEVNGENVLMTTIAVPIKNSAGSTVGVAGVDLSLSSLQNITFDKGQYDSAYVYVVSNSGNFIIHPDESFIGENMADVSGLANAEQIDAVKNGDEYSAEQLDQQTGEQVENLLMPIHIGETTTPWSTGMAVNMSEVLEPSNHTTLMLILMLVGALVAIGLILAFIIKRTVSKPIQTTANFAKELADGNLDEKIEIKSMDEIGQLSSILDKEVRDAFKNIVRAQQLAKKTKRLPKRTG